MRSIDNIFASRYSRIWGLVLLSMVPIPMVAHGDSPSSTCTVAATIETVPVASQDDAADDPCIWVHPSDRSQSRIIGTDKQKGLGVYALDGSLVQFLSDGEMNNVDVRYGFSLGERTVDIVTAGNRSDNTIGIYTVDPTNGTLTEAAARKIELSFDVYGACMYRSAEGKYYAVVTSKDGVVEQWELRGTATEKIDAARVRAFDVGGQTEGCVADDALGMLYLAEENVGIWKYPADPGDRDPTRTKVDGMAPAGRLTPDVEGLAIVYTGPKKGYLIASSQGSSEFVVYRREAMNEFVTAFRVGPSAGIDEVTGTDGLDATSASLGDRFPSGVVVVQDDENGTEPQNFKLVPLDAIVCEKVELATGYDPRSRN